MRGEGVALISEAIGSHPGDEVYLQLKSPMTASLGDCPHRPRAYEAAESYPTYDAPQIGEQVRKKSARGRKTTANNQEYS